MSITMNPGDTESDASTLRTDFERLDTLLCPVGPTENQRALAQKQASMQTQLDTIADPVLSLPPEVVSEIFIHCLCDTRARPNFAEAPLLLCNICSDWRSIATATPALWSSLELTFKFSLFGSRFIALLAIWLSRTGSHPLSLSLGYDEYTAAKRRHQLDQLVNLLIQHCDQWEEVELKLPDASEFDQFKASFPALKMLTVGHSGKPFTTTVSSFTDTPSLMRIHLNEGCALGPVAWKTIGPQLTVLKCEALHVDECLRLLRTATRIVEFTVHLKEGGSHMPGGPFLLPTLRTLHLLREECHMDLLQHLTLPALETLSISFENEDIPRFLSFLSRSACPLVRVIFDAWPFDQIELVRCLRAMPSLHELQLWRPQYFTDSFLRQLADPEFLLPNLTILDLNHVYPIQFTMPALVGMLSCRWNAPVRLESFRTLLHKASMVADAESLFRLQVLVAAGMKIHIDYH
ncbi:hypothetical protein C8R44DRAFT_344067 [Mycena epipterygia]|nr:hypothetical protein C8R44DRAFT_344067 [Mycena epipterygia]